MTFVKEKIKAVCFDFGNTLVEFGPDQIAVQYASLVSTLTGMFGSCDAGLLKTVRDRQILMPFENGYKENNLQTLCKEVISEIYGTVLEVHQVEKLVETRYQSFVRAVALPEGVMPLLKKLNRRYRLGLLSNYPCGRSVRYSLTKVGLTEIFETVVVSGDIGYVKPHAAPYAALLSQLDLYPSECVYVGDNWLADVQGAKRAGMNSILTTQYVPYERFEPRDGDHQPDLIIEDIAELERILLP